MDEATLDAIVAELRENYSWIGSEVPESVMKLCILRGYREALTEELRRARGLATA